LSFSVEQLAKLITIKNQNMCVVFIDIKIEPFG
jgi:hypothetical protein